MPSTPVPRLRIELAAKYLANADVIAQVCREADVPFAVACALFDKESKGKNVWGNDVGGMFAELPSNFVVNRGAYEVFEHYVVGLGRTSNGVGPAQITWRGFFPDMRAKGLRPWNVHDNMLYGLQLLADYRAVKGASWEDAGTRYNGARTYGQDFVERINWWRTYLGGDD